MNTLGLLSMAQAILDYIDETIATREEHSSDGKAAEIWYERHIAATKLRDLLKE